jgi:tetratricopeptide (TPR) repeat protein
MTSAAIALLFACGEPPQITPPDPTAARQLVREGLALYGFGLVSPRRDRLAEAARRLEEAIRIDPHAVPPRQLLVEVYKSLGRQTDAVAAAAAVLIMDQSCTGTGRTLARLLHEMKRTGEAITVLHRCLKTADRPVDRIVICHDLAILYAAVGARPQAVDSFRKALGLTTQHRSELLLAAGAAELDRQRANLSAELATTALAAGQFGEARDAALEARDGFRKLDDEKRAGDLTPTLAAAYAGLGERAKAQSLLDKHLLARPRDVPAFAYKAKLLRESGDGGDAVELLKQAVDNAPDCTPLRVLLGDECRKAGDRHLAQASYRAVIDLKPDVAAYRGLLALLAGPGGDAIEILNLIDEKAKEARPQKDDDGKVDEPTRKRRDAAAEHVRAIRAALRQEPAAAGLALTAAADSHRQGGPFGGDGYSYYTWMILADVAEHAGQLGTAETALRRAIRGAGHANEAMAYSALIHVLGMKLDRPAIAQLCQDALKRAPNTYHFLFHYHLARALAGLDDIKGALEHADVAIRMATEPIATSCETRIFALVYAGRFEQAEQECMRLLGDAKKSDDVIHVRHELARVYSAARRFDQSEEQLRLVLELDPDDAAAHNSLGYELADRNRNLDEAERLVRRALELDRARKSDSLDDEESPHYLDSLGWVLFRRGRLAEARELIERSASLPAGSISPEVWDHLGDICARMGKPDDAAAAWERARALAKTEMKTADDPRGAEIERKLARIKKEK